MLSNRLKTKQKKGFRAHAVKVTFGVYVVILKLLSRNQRMLTQCLPLQTPVVQYIFKHL